MNRSTIYLSSCMAVGALLFPSFVDQVHAACNPPKDVSSCVQVPKELVAQARPALPEPPFPTTHPQTGKTLLMTDFNNGLKTPKPVPGNSNCNPSNVNGCARVPSTKLMNSSVTAPFLIQFQDGRSLLASPMLER
jgi:hypothetical protein